MAAVLQQCDNHWFDAASAQCDDCRLALCDACVLEVPRVGVLCHACALRRAGVRTRGRRSRRRGVA